MADFSITINNSVNLFGQGPATKWGSANGYGYTMIWGTTKWGEGTFSLVFSVEKLIENTQSFLGAYQGSLVEKLIDNSITITSFSAEVEGLTNGIWSVVFPSDTTNAKDRDVASYVSDSASALSFTCQAAGSTVWS